VCPICLRKGKKNEPEEEVSGKKPLRRRCISRTREPSPLLTQNQQQKSPQQNINPPVLQIPTGTVSNMILLFKMFKKAIKNCRTQPKEVNRVLLEIALKAQTTMKTRTAAMKRAKIAIAQETLTVLLPLSQKLNQLSSYFLQLTTITRDLRKTAQQITPTNRVIQDLEKRFKKLTKSVINYIAS
jgi:hypothetical protein